MANTTPTYATSWRTSTSPSGEFLASPDLRIRSSRSPSSFPDLQATAPPTLVTNAENEPPARGVFLSYDMNSPGEQDVEKAVGDVAGETMARMGIIDPRLLGELPATGDLIQTGQGIEGVPGIYSADSGGSSSTSASASQIPESQDPASSDQHTPASISTSPPTSLSQDPEPRPTPQENSIPRTITGPHSTHSAAHCCGFALMQPPLNLTSFRQRLLTWAAGISQWTSFEKKPLSMVGELTGRYEYAYEIRRKDNFPGGTSSTRIFIGGDAYRSVPYELIGDFYTMHTHDRVKYRAEQLQIACQDQGRHSKIVIEVWMSRRQQHEIQEEEYDERLLGLSDGQVGGFIQG